MQMPLVRWVIIEKSTSGGGWWDEVRLQVHLQFIKRSYKQIESEMLAMAPQWPHLCRFKPYRLDRAHKGSQEGREDVEVMEDIESH